MQKMDMLNEPMGPPELYTPGGLEKHMQNLQKGEHMDVFPGSEVPERIKRFTKAEKKRKKRAKKQAYNSRRKQRKGN